MTRRLGVFARAFPVGAPREVGSAVADAGYGLVQLNLKAVGLPTLPEPAEWEAIDPSAIREAFASAGVAIWGLSASGNLCHPDPDLRRAATERARDVIAHAAEFGASCVTLCTGSRDAERMWGPHPDNGTEEAWSDMLTEVRILARTATEHGVRIGVEPETGLVVDDADAILRLFDDLGDDASAVGIVLDPANLVTADPLRAAEIVDDAFTRLGARVVCVHAKDPAGWRSVFDGDGVNDFGQIARLRATYCPDVPVIVQDVRPEQAGDARELLERALRAAV